MHCSNCGKDIPNKVYRVHQVMCVRRSVAMVATQGNTEPTPALTVVVPTVTTEPVSVPATQVVLEAPGTAGDRVSIQAEPQPQPLPVSDTGANGSEVFYPKPDPYFMVNGFIAEALRVTEAMSHKKPTNLLITGQPGGGKTSLALQFAAKYGRPAVVADFGVMQEPQQLFQTTRLITVDGHTVTDTRESGFVRGIETENCMVVMDEMTRVENERVLNPLMPFLDGRKEAWIDDLRRRVHVANGVIFIATINEGALFCGITSLDLALRDRFREVFMDYLPAEQEAKVIMDKTCVPQDIAYSLAQFGYAVRNAPSITRKVSTRQLLHAAEAYTEGTDLWKAVETAIGNYGDLEWRQQVLQVLSLSFKDETEYQKWLNKKEPEYARY